MNNSFLPKTKKIFVYSILIIVFFGFSKIGVAQATGIPVFDTIHTVATEAQTANDTADNTKDTLLEKLKKALAEAGSHAYASALNTTLKQMAYDTATYLATGNEGQKPMFFKEGWGEFLNNVGDAAFGNFIEELGQDWGFNLCQPSFDVQLKITLGLVQYSRPKAPDCTWSEMKSSWSDEFKRLKDLNSDDFLKKFQNIFEPASNDLGAALTVQTGMLEMESKQKEKATKDREEGDGWLDFKKIPEWRTSVPGSAEKETTNLYNVLTEHLGDFTGSALIDAANIFANQYAITLIKEQLRRLADNTDTITSPYTGDYGGLTDYEFGGTSGIAEAEAKFRKITEPDFTVRGDYNVLAELSTCIYPNKPGPTNCVIENDFRQAIEGKMTVVEAVDSGLLDRGGIFGFDSQDLEPNYENKDYPYRSMRILRKYRIVPVGWELAAQYIRDNDVGTCSLGDMMACYSGEDEYEVETNSSCRINSWCQGLVDPNWVLKAPLNYCKREGYGPEIIMSQIFGEKEDSNLSISRNDNYCADEQTCIKETSGGSCDKYGYCTEEKGVWNFNSDSCNPDFNTCQTFTKVDGDGQRISYLENTLDYCDESGVGCRAYCTDYDILNNKWNCSDVSDSTLLFNKNIGQCDSENEGCHEFIRTKSGLGTNLLKNSGFENDLDAWIKIGPGETEVEKGDSRNGGFSNILKITHDGTSSYTGVNQVINDIYPGEKITVSYYVKTDFDTGPHTGAWVVAYARNVLTAILPDPQTNKSWMEESVISNTYSGENQWKRVEFTFVTPELTDNILIQPRVQKLNNVAYFDDIQVERGEQATEYKDYRQRNLVYIKLLPEYLQDICYNDLGDHYELKEDAPLECSNFARQCKEEEAGCELYTSQTDNTQIPAKTTAQDECDAVCVGYDTFIASETHYDITQAAYFIPNTADKCSAEAVGCEEFTNLDKLGSGAEELEYYSRLKNCIKPGPTCEEFYTWEGNAESGFQIHVHQLKAVGGEPDADDTNCSEAIYNSPTSDPGHNSDCREFYNQAGQVSYYLYSSIIECTDDCHPYRLTDPVGDMSEDKCVNDLEGEWIQDACVFMAIPEQGQKCSAQQAGCREYNGNQGNDTRILFTEDFEGDHDWQNGSISSASVIAGEHSLLVSDATNLAVDDIANNGFAYSLSFIAKGVDPGVELGIYFDNGTVGEENDFAAVSLGNTEWQYFETNLESLDHEISGEEKLIISSGGNSFFIDNIRLTEIRDRYYLIKNSWTTPEVCDQDINGNYSLHYDLGCDYYKDRDGLDYYLHNFTELCPDSAAGCELMVDTHNYSDYEAGDWSDYGVSVPSDSAAYVAYTPDKECFQEDKGCQFLGQIYNYEDELYFNDNYLKNNPDDYGNILCGADDVGCAAWDHDGGPSYFKDPEDMVCEWRQEGNAFGWYKVKVKRCDGTESVCVNNSQCEADQECKLEESANACEVSSAKTFGLGGTGNMVYQPNEENWAALCPASEAGCSEYIDPVSKFSTNLIFNPSFANIDGQGPPNDGDGWDGDKQNVRIEPYTLYILKSSNNTSATIGECSDENEASSRLIKFNLATNALATSTIASVNTINPNNSVMFYTNNSVNCVVSGGKENKTIELRKVIVSYQFKQELDRESCEGIVDNNKGCVLFNERVVDRNNYSVLDKNAELSTNYNSWSSAEPNNANALIKVTPDRVCSEWLACRSYAKNDDGEEYCFDLGTCNSFDDNDQCNNFTSIEKSATNQNLNNLNKSDIHDMSGYSIVSYSPDSGYYKVPSDLYNVGDMSQKGDAVNIQNGGFEFAGENNYPIGWVYENSGTQERQTEPTTEYDASTGTLVETSETVREWNKNIFKVIDNPFDASVEGICYHKMNDGNCFLFNPEGKSFLELSANNDIVSESLDVAKGQEYMLSAYINTKNLSGAKGVLAIINANNDEKIETTELAAGNGWTLKVIDFTAPSDGERIKIKFFAEGTGKISGKLYLDDVQIKPFLQAKDNFKINQECRLYPEDSSLSCDYYDDSGIEQRGWSGYCLQYDISPGNKNACLLWYPIDKVRGSGIEEGAGYSGRYPVYYCGGVDMDFSVVEPRAQALINYRHTSGYTALGIFTSWMAAFAGPLFDGGDWFSSWGGVGISDPTVNPIMQLSKEFKNSLGVFIPNSSEAIIGVDTPATGYGKFNNCYGSGCYNDIVDPSNIDNNGNEVNEEGLCPFGYYYSYKLIKHRTAFRKNYYLYEYCNPVQSDYVTSSNETIGAKGINIDWYEYNGDLQKVGKNQKGYKVVDETAESGKFQGLSKPVQVYFYKTKKLMPFDEAYNNNLLMQCKVVYQTVSSTGDNKAWHGRVSGDGDYEIKMATSSDFSGIPIDNSNIKYSSTFSPFGAMNGGIYPQYNPYEWDSNLDTEEAEPYDVGYKMAGGISYSCTDLDGDGHVDKNCARLGICSGGNNSCFVYSVLGGLALKKIEPMKGNSGYNITPYKVFNFPQNFTCGENEVCIPLENVSQNTVKDNLKKVFAKNYGVWEWQNSDKVCSGGYFDGYPCSDDASCSSKCEPHCYYSKTDNNNNITKEYYGSPCDPNNTSYLTDDDNTYGVGDAIGGTDGRVVIYNDCTKDRAGVCNFSTNKCEGGYRDGEDCDSNEACKEGVCEYVQGECLGVCDGGANDGKECRTDQAAIDCGQNINCKSATCSGGCTEGLSCTSNAQCDPAQHSSDICKDKNKCEGGYNNGNLCSQASDCEFPPDFQLQCLDSFKACVGTDFTSANTPKTCEGDNECQEASVCVPDDSAGAAKDPHYYPVNKDSNPDYYWEPPTHKCGLAGYSRDSNDLDKNYCGIPPVVDNVVSNIETIHRNGFVNLRFNSDADDQQMPLVMYKVDWGDGKNTLVSGVEMMDRPYSPEPDENNPHSLYYLYNYWDLKSKAIEGVGNIECAMAGAAVNGKTCSASSNCCFVRPGVMIQDNWGWCSGDDTRGECDTWQLLASGYIRVDEK